MTQATAIDKLCIIETCKKIIPLMRIEMQPKVVTCDKYCSKEHMKNLRRANAKKQWQRRHAAAQSK